MESGTYDSGTILTYKLVGDPDLGAKDRVLVTDKL